MAGDYDTSWSLHPLSAPLESGLAGSRKHLRIWCSFWLARRTNRVNLDWLGRSWFCEHPSSPAAQVRIATKRPSSERMAGLCLLITDDGFVMIYSCAERKNETERSEYTEVDFTCAAAWCCSLILL